MGGCDETRTIVFTVESMGQDGSTIRHKVVGRFVDDQRRVATAYLMAGAEIVKRTEVQYTRATPCPDRVRIIFDGLEKPSGG